MAVSSKDQAIASSTLAQAAACGYSLLGERGRGSYGTVYEASNENNELFAYKYLPFEKPGFEERYSEHGVDDLVEIDVLSRFNHPNVMHAKHILTRHNCKIEGVALVMPLAEESLFQAIFGRKRFNTYQKLGIIYGVARGLEFLHLNHILHLDVKILNIVLKKSEPFLIDFGIAMIVDDVVEGKNARALKITVDFRPPEILRGGRQYNAACDVWSLAVVMLYCFRENEVWKTDLLKINTPEEQRDFAGLIERKLDNPAFLEDMLYTVNTKYQKAAKDLVKKCLSVDPKKRPTMLEFCAHPLFDDFRNFTTGTLLETPLPETFLPDHRDIVKLIVHWCQTIYEALSSELLFLAVDIFNRCCKDFNERGTSFRILAAATSLWMADKIVNEERALMLGNYMPEITKMAPKANHREMRACELEIIHVLRGILYVNKLYRSCRNTEQLQFCFREIVMSKDSSLYSRVDIEGLKKILDATYAKPWELPVSIRQVLA